MQLAKVALLLVLRFSSTLSFSQTLVERSFLVRVETTTFDPYSGMTHICILVFPDGHYRMERSFQSNQFGRGEDKIYLDTLPEGNVKELQAALENEQFQRINTGEARGGMVQDMDMLSVTVPREHVLQNITFVNAAARKPFEKELKPFLNWVKTVQKRKVPPAKTETANNCVAPRVMYRGVMPPNEDPPK